MANSTIEKLIEAGIQFTEMSKKQADAFVSKLVKTGDVQRQEAERVAQALMERGRESSERIAALVQSEVARAVGSLSERFDELEDRFEDFAEMLNERVPGAAKPSAKTAPAKKAPAKKSAAKKSAAKKSAAKKSAAKKSAAVGSSGVRKVSASRNG